MYWMPHLIFSYFFNYLGKCWDFIKRKYITWNIENQGCFSILFDIYVFSAGMLIGYTLFYQTLRVRENHSRD